MTVTSSAVAPPGSKVAARGTAVTSNVRVAVDTGRVIEPVANAGRLGAPAIGVPSSAVRAVRPTTSIVTSRPGTAASVIGMSNTADPSVAVKRLVSTMPARVITARPSPANGACTRSDAEVPTSYSARSGTIVRDSCSTLRLGTASLPLTQTVSSVRFRPPSSSVTTARTRYEPPTSVVNSQRNGWSVVVTAHVCGSISISVHSPST